MRFVAQIAAQGATALPLEGFDALTNRVRLILTHHSNWTEIAIAVKLIDLFLGQ